MNCMKIGVGTSPNPRARNMLPLANAKVVFRSRWYADWRHITPVYIEVI
jgi:hypothetical protein